MTKYKILFIGNFNVDYTTEEHWSKEYEGLGHEVIRCQEDRMTSDKMLELSEGCDFVHYVHSHGFRTPGSLSMNELLDTLKKEGIPTVSVHLDIMRGLDREGDVFTEAFWKTEYVFTADGGSNDWYREHGINHFYLPAGVYSAECEIGNVRPEFQHDVIFVGARYGYHKEWKYREQLINWLEQTYGDRFALYGRDGRGMLRGQDLNDLYASAKVVVGDTLCQGFDWPDYFSDRMTETTGRGGFLIMPYIPGIRTMFTEEELVTYEFKDFAGLKDKIDYFLEHEDERREIQMAGHHRCLTDHSYSNRVREVVRILEKDGALNGKSKSREQLQTRDDRDTRIQGVD